MNSIALLVDSSKPGRPRSNGAVWQRKITNRRQAFIYRRGSSCKMPAWWEREILLLISFLMLSLMGQEQKFFNFFFNKKQLCIGLTCWERKKHGSSHADHSQLNTPLPFIIMYTNNALITKHFTIGVYIMMGLSGSCVHGYSLPSFYGGLY